MDIDSFQQCLSYVELSNPAKGYIDKIITASGALAGAALGFTLNYIHSKSKESTSEKNKIMCCKEDIHRVHAYLARVMIDSVQMTSILINRRSLLDNNFVDFVSSLLLEKYYSEIAHRFTKNQRIWIQELISNLQIVNSKLLEFKKLTITGNTYQATLILFSLTDGAASCAHYCSMILSDTAHPQPPTVEMLRYYNIESSLIEDHLLAKSNAQHGNKEFNL